MSPFSLEKTYYEVRLWRSITEIPITNGSGDISLSVADKTIIEANKVLNEGGSTYVSLQGKQKGSTTLTLTDNVTGDEETVEVKAEQKTQSALERLTEGLDEALAKNGLTVVHTKPELVHPVDYSPVIYPGRPRKVLPPLDDTPLIQVHTTKF